MAEVMIGIIGGTGLGEALVESMAADDIQRVEVATPFGAPSSPVITGSHQGVRLALLSRHGDGHRHNPAQVPYRANVYALKSLGCTHIIASGATGSLRESIAPGDLVICDQVIDRTVARPRTFFDAAAVHVEFAEPFCPIARRWLLAAADGLHGVTVHATGTYVCMEGPSFSTRAESNLYRQWGADVVGMTALPEARLAREAEMAYALLALPTDYDCWRPRAEEADEMTLLQEIVANLNQAIEVSIRLIKAALSDVATIRESRSPAHDALKLGIWSDKTKIPRAEVDRLRVLWGRYF